MKQEIKELVDRILEEDDASAREKFCEALIGFKNDAMEFVLPHLSHDDWAIRYRIANIIGSIGITDKETFLVAEEALEQEVDEYVQKSLVKALTNARIEIITPFSKEVNTENVVKIWKFNAEEASPIKEIFKSKDIAFREFVVCFGHPEYASYEEEVAFEVPQEQIQGAVGALLADFFGMNSGNSFTGECPACATEVKSVVACPECELSLEMNPMDAIEVHHFGKCLAHLLENGVIESSILGDNK